MSSYRGEVGAWDGGPPGAEADYAPPPPPAPVPTTDPWTGVSYSQYGPSQYDYQGYGSSAYGYNYDSTYYQRADGGYYDASSAYPPPPADTYDYSRSQERPRSPHSSRSYGRRRASYRSKSRSVSPYDRRPREYSKKRDTSYEDSRWRRSRSASKTKYNKYSSSDRSSYKSRSYSRSPKHVKQERRSSSDSSRSGRSYKKSVTSKNDRSLTPPLKNRPQTRHRSRSNDDKVRSPSKYKHDKVSKNKGKSSGYYDSKSKDRRERDVFTPPRNNVSDSPQSRKKSDTPPAVYKRSERSPQRKKNYKDRKSLTPQRNPRDSSVTPPRCYARSRSSSRSHSCSRSITPKTKRKRSSTPKSRRSRSSSSSQSSASSRSSQSKERDRRKSSSKHGSRSKSRSRGRSVSMEGSSSPRTTRLRGRRSRSPRKSKSRSRSRSAQNRSPSHSTTPSDEECRGQFTVADRKRFWKKHRSRQEQADKSKSPVKEVRPPPGAVETTYAYDVEYGDPPEVEGPNFAELLPPPDQSLQIASSSKSKPMAIPIKNDGSFLEMFKKMQEETKKVEEAEKKPVVKKPILPFIGKRRGGRVLKTGLVKKAKAIDEQTVDNTPKDAWSLYMQEVKKYRETSCEEERKTRPLVK